MKFDGQWKIDWDWYERLDNNGDIIFRKIKSRPEYYVEDKKGTFNSLIGNKKLAKKIGKPPKNIKHLIYSTFKENDVNIRDNYWNEDNEKTKYNLNPRIWYIDIETTAKNGINVENTTEEVVLIQIYDSKLEKMIVIGSREWPDEFNFFDQEKYGKNENLKKEDVKYINAGNESGIFKMFFALISKLKPLIVLGWNTLGFDYPYLYNRSKLLGFSGNEFSPFNQEVKLHLKKLDNGQVTYTFSVPGIYFMDYLDLYKKFTFGERQSFSLDFISEYELNKRKVNHNMYSSFDGFRTGEDYIFPDKIPEEPYDLKMYKLQKEYKNNPSKELKEKIHNLANDLFVYYGLIDTFRVKELDDKLQLIDIILMISSKMGITLADSLGTVKPWGSYIEKVAYNRKKILPPDEKSESQGSVKGGYVADPKRGRHSWVQSVDISSAYPRLGITAFNMSPETYVPINEIPDDLAQLKFAYFNDEDEEKRIQLYKNSPEIFEKFTKLLQKYNYSGSINGAFFKRDEQGLIPELVTTIFDERRKQKKLMLEWKDKASHKRTRNEDNSYELYMASRYNTAQLVSKVLINGLYGAIAMKYFRLFNIDIARAITGNTRFYILLLSKRIEEYLQSIIPFKSGYSVYNDTDSFYFTLEPIITKLQDSRKLSKDVNSTVDWIDNFIKKKIDKVIEKTNKEFSTIFNAYKPEVIVTEREVISDSARSSTPDYFKKKLIESIDIILDKDISDLKDWLKNVREEVTKVPLSDIAKTTGIGSLNYKLNTKETDKNGRTIAIPINSRAALAVNNFIDSDKKLRKRFNKISTSDKVKLLYLNEPNPLGQNVIAFKEPELAEMFRDYIDYDLVFDKYFIAPLELMIEPIENGKWKQKLNSSTNDLDEW